LKLLLASVASRRLAKSEPCETLVRDYITRATRYAPTETATYPSEDALLATAGRQPGRPAAIIVLCDASGELLTSDALAGFLRLHRDASTPRMLFAIGPADGWSQPALTRAAKVISFGRITLPHELARVVLAEQIYRALTIVAGHPYHSGH
jgi:23S rRNA (pseudouridine1915-N3)-methyltransferase